VLESGDSASNHLIKQNLYLKQILQSIKAFLLGKRSRNPCEWEYLSQSWPDLGTTSDISGWTSPDIVRVYERKWARFVQLANSTCPLGFSHESELQDTNDISAHNLCMTFAYVLGRAAETSGSISILDWGGGVGHYYVLAKALYPTLRITYACKDFEQFARKGANLSPSVSFFSDDSCLDNKYDLVITSTSLHYSPEWQVTLRQLARASQNYLYVASTPSVCSAASFVFVQRPIAYGYNTEYVSWCINRNELLREAKEAHLELEREFIYGYAPDIKGAPEQNTYRGYLFRK
jgi:putative methyltransferase (TIGR04325 family)